LAPGHNILNPYKSHKSNTESHHQPTIIHPEAPTAEHVSGAIGTIRNGTWYNISIYRKNNEIKSGSYVNSRTADEALAIWNRELGLQDQLYQELARYSAAAVRDKFHGSLWRWREFVLLVKSGAYLMGEKCRSWFCPPLDVVVQEHEKDFGW
jgi:hypothetical protein